MKPQGRKYTLHSAKWKVKENGKNITGWWENCIPPSKTREKRFTSSDIEEGILTYKESL